MQIASLWPRLGLGPTVEEKNGPSSFPSFGREVLHGDGVYPSGAYGHVGGLIKETREGPMSSLPPTGAGPLWVRMTDRKGRMAGNPWCLLDPCPFLF
jgi:hypothetical protein